MTLDRLKNTAALAAALTLGACASVNDATRNVADAVTLYRPDVVQGNFVSGEQAQALKPGMTRLQVRDLLGTPLLASVFHADRWDYVFTMQRQGVPPQHFRLTIYFNKDGALERSEGGGDLPGENEFAQHIGEQAKPKVPVLQASQEQLDRFPPSPASAPVAAAEEPAPPPAGSYPPLEPASGPTH
ncbi:MAG: outer membrane protein assembly factor BamE [Burkholderiaceae bacterium]|jgi:outer membrane protein assembly factor BamE|nr:outer membrane protein assembly factor BamE [Burkholderiaceae bacterium]